MIPSFLLSLFTGGNGELFAGKQGKHVAGHPSSIPGTKSPWPEGENGVGLTQKAWMKGRKANDDGAIRVHDFKRPVGHNGEMKVKIHRDGNGEIHGYPKVEMGK